MYLDGKLCTGSMQIISRVRDRHLEEIVYAAKLKFVKGFAEM